MSQQQNSERKVSQPMSLQCPQDFEPEKNYGHKFRMLHNGIEKFMEFRRGNNEEVLTSVQCATLRYLIQRERNGQEVFQKDIEAAFSIRGATASNILKGMEKKGLIERIPTEYDARLKRIILTDLAYEGDRKAKCNVYRMEQTIIKGMTEEEARLFNDLLERALHNVEELCRFEEKGESK